MLFRPALMLRYNMFPLPKTLRFGFNLYNRNRHEVLGEISIDIHHFL
jgi:hypothetical protein